MIGPAGFQQAPKVESAPDSSASWPEITRGRVYRAKKPANNGGLVNDRVVLYMDIFIVQYDGPAVVHGRHYPKVSREAFAKWAGRDVTDEMPPGKWASWKAGVK